MTDAEQDLDIESARHIRLFIFVQIAQIVGCGAISHHRHHHRTAVRGSYAGSVLSSYENDTVQFAASAAPSQCPAKKTPTKQQYY